ncbi:beta strand repeat-containing protein [Streptacidiphilus carbonis]|uniref:beta strand repeat-containing protein n=1 Tax=Streptacidiphilus carbonis TaxID=105422 RepID=UPI001376B7A1|nr:PKD domain-containing protein [Streptacidiphilus carbonis]
MPTRSIAASATLAVAVAACLAVVPSTAHADGSTIYVSNRATANCSDSAADAGSQAQPYCTLQPAVDAAQPGDTVAVLGGNYLPVDIRTSGSASAPITIAQQGKVFADIVVPAGGTTAAITFDHVHNVTVRGFFVGSNGASSPVVAVSGSHGVTLDGDRVDGDDSPSAVAVDGSSSDVTLSRDEVDSQPGGAGAVIAAGAAGTVVTADRFYYWRGVPLQVNGATGTDVVGNTFDDQSGCNTALVLSGTSTDTTVENNAILLGDNGGCSGYGTSTPVIVSAGAAGSTTLDFNTVEDRDTASAFYNWAGTSYATPAALDAGTGQGAHDTDFRTTVSSDVLAPLIDSANADAPGETVTDGKGHSRVDDPLAADTGSGAFSYYDRGATETQDPYAAVPTVSVAEGPAPLTETVSAVESNPWHTRIASYTFDFGDGSTPVTTSSPSTAHTYTSVGNYRVSTTATAADGTVFTSTKQAYVTAAKTAPLVPSLSLSHAYGMSSLTVRTDATATTDDWSITDHTVDFGDGTAPVDLGAAFGGVTNHTYAAPGTYTVTLTLQDAGGRTADTTSTTTVGSVFVPFGPTRMLDTRTGLGALKAKVGAGGVVRLKVAGADGIPSSGVSAVTLNLTGVNASAGTYVTAYPDGGSTPTASNLNLVVGQVTPNLATVRVGADGYVDLYNHAGTVDLVADVEGYYSTSAPVDTAGAGFDRATALTRVLDTRNGTGTGKGKVLAGGVVTVQLPTGSYTNASAVLLNLTATDTSSAGWVGVEPSTGGVPASSALNFTTGQTTSNLVVAPVNSSGQVQFYNRTGSVDLVADLEGTTVSDPTSAVAATAAAQAGAPYFPVSPTRVLDTRNGTGAVQRALGANSTLAVAVAGVQGIPAGATAVVLNLTGVGATSATGLTVRADGTSATLGSDLTLAAGATRADLVMVPVGADGKIEIANSAGSVNVVADIEGYCIG